MMFPQGASFSRTSLPPRVCLSGTSAAPFRVPANSADAAAARFDMLKVGRVEEKLLQELDALTKLPRNWDGEGGAAPTESTVDTASVFLVEMNEAARREGLNVPEPKILAGGDGSVGFVWRHPSAPWTLEVEVGAQGGISYVGSVLGRVHEGTLTSPEELLALSAIAGVLFLAAQLGRDQVTRK